MRGIIKNHRQLAEEITRLREQLEQEKAAHTKCECKSHLLESIALNTPVIIYRVDKDGRFTESLGAGLKRLGLKENEVVGQSALEMYAGAAHQIQQAIEGKTSCELQRGQSGSQEWSFINYVAPDESGNGAIGFAIDNTKHQQAERDLQQHSCVFSNIYDGVIICDSENRIVNWNPGAQAMFGYSKEEALGKTTAILHRPEDASWLTDMVMGEIKNCGTWRGEITFVRKDGTTGVCETLGVAVRDEKDNFLYGIGVNRDITKRKQAEERLEQAKQAAEEANKKKGEFLANMSHEIRTPLSAIVGYAEVMTTASPSEIKRLHCISRIKYNAEQLRRLIDDILDVSKVEAGKIEIEQIRFAFIPELAKIFLELKNRADQKDIDLQINFEGETPQTITSDPFRLRQILNNIVGNAIKFTPGNGTVELSVRLRLPTPEDLYPILCFTVEDTGCGIPPELHDAIFEGFVQGNQSRTRDFGGAGLGLTLSRHLAHLMGGDIQLVNSIPGKGTVIEVTIHPGPLDDVPMVQRISSDRFLEGFVPPF